MKVIAKRLRRLEDQFGPGDGKPRKLLLVCNAGWGLALDRDTCIQVLDECGFLPTHGFGLVNLGEIPESLNAEETERFLRGNVAEILGQAVVGAAI